MICIFASYHIRHPKVSCVPKFSKKNPALKGGVLDPKNFDNNLEIKFRAYYPLVQDKLKLLGFKGEFVEFLAKTATWRQLIEDGNKPNHISCVGMIAGGINKEVIATIKKFNPLIKISIITANDGYRVFNFTGPLANVWSTVAIVLVWQKYLYKFNFKNHHISSWYESKLTGKMNGDTEKVIYKANNIFGPKAKSIKKLVEKFD